MEIKKDKILKYGTVFLAAILVIIFVMKVSILRELIYLFVISFLITYVLKPFYMKLLDSGAGESISALLLIAGIAAILVGGFMVFIPYLFRENLNVKNTLNSIQDLINNIYASLKPDENSGILHTFTDNMYYRMHDMTMKISGKIYEFIINMSSMLIYAVIVPIIVYYFLVDGKQIEHGILNLFPIRSRNAVYKISCHIDKILGRYIVSQLILSLVVGIVTFIILVLLKVDFPIVLSIINAFFNIIPYFGPIFGALPAIFVAFMNSPKTAVEVAIWLYVLQQLEGNILSPKITADSISMHPLTVIVLLLIGGGMAGFIGMVAAVPLGVVVKIIYKDLSYYIF
ncbi:MAG: AI-2E family transporter [Clostridium sp.]|jgi:predicted PurR-regulated permease PerM|uniref:AI-2E family transporter n=1 Tax=Clostridium sp. TaxID=1506 RepID=UPI0025BDE806|nr:AI-2E family transporter [Clostridium sp.]MCH3964094.1 AI-2E family transporter [Clostridium sp.]MCI1716295.1 AI-2E family transporter [Clostridium sp.]MCI1800465.1 AI-2E family transporter [Clostridium sp.]MCI1814472.1 AI-2E family transporter [Clostridium sp.]MCI1871371.1 AI-2E family transporter [Clostridium sp.]